MEKSVVERKQPKPPLSKPSIVTELLLKPVGFDTGGTIAALLNQRKL